VGIASLTTWRLFILSALVQPDKTSRESIPFSLAKICQSRDYSCRLSPTIKNLERGTSAKSCSCLIRSNALVDGFPIIVGLIPVAVSKKLRIQPFPATNLEPIAMFLSILHPIKAALFFYM
jgi:hypothetical protein